MNPALAVRYGDLEEWHWWFRGRQRILMDVLQRELPLGVSRRVLAVGAGPTDGLTWLTPLAGPRGWVTGLDVDPIHAKVSGAGLHHIVGDITTPPLRSASADVVLALDVLEHLDDDVAALGEVRRLLKPDGLLVVTVPAMPSLWGAQDEINLHRRRYTRRTLLQLFAGAGLPPPHVSYFNTLLFPFVAAVRWGRRLTGHSQRMRTDFDDNRPGLVNDVLASVFATERHLVRHISLPLGVSLLATVRTAAPGQDRPAAGAQRIASMGARG